MIKFSATDYYPKVCGKDCLALRDNAVCGRCGNLLKMHTGVGHSLCHQGQYCPGFQLKVRSARCPCGHAPEDHVCIFFRDRTTGTGATSNMNMFHFAVQYVPFPKCVCDVPVLMLLMVIIALGLREQSK